MAEEDIIHEFNCTGQISLYNKNNTMINSSINPLVTYRLDSAIIWVFRSKNVAPLVDASTTTKRFGFGVEGIWLDVNADNLNNMWNIELKR